MRTTRYALAGLISLALVAAAGTGFAQDTHYWNSQYGPRGILLGGAVIGSIADMSATYYNPGALGYVEKPEVLLSANVCQTSKLTIRDGAGAGIDLDTTDFNILPNMLAGGFRKSWLGKNKFAYSFLTRYRFKAEIQGARVARDDILNAPGEEEFAGSLTLTNDAKELWAGLTWSRGLNEKIGVGITTYFSAHKQTEIDRVFAQALTDSGDVALVFEVDNFSNTVYSLLWKAGLGFDLTPLTLGLTVTTPNLQLSGSGEAAVNMTTVGLDTVDDGFQTNIQQDIAGNYKSPLAVGIGAGFSFSKTKLHASAEWFDSVDTYEVLELQDFVSQATGETVQRSLVQKLDSVTNFAAGVEQRFGERALGYLSFTTDFSAFNPASDVSATGFDIYHVTGGATIKSRRTRFTLGLSYSWGSETIQQTIDLNPGGDNPVVDPSNQVELDYRSVTFIIGFSVDV
jgi:hypothetical protein